VLQDPFAAHAVKSRIREVELGDVAHGVADAAVPLCGRRDNRWAIDSTQKADLAANALGMAIDSRQPSPGGIIHGDHGTQFTSWAFTTRAKNAGLLPSLGTVGDPYDNAVVESFWGRMQVELLNRRRWRTRVEFANAIFEYIEGFHNRRRRHSAIGFDRGEADLRQSPEQPADPGGARSSPHFRGGCCSASTACRLTRLDLLTRCRSHVTMISPVFCGNTGSL
jgi:transposase InsO family protein